MTPDNINHLITASGICIALLIFMWGGVEMTKEEVLQAMMLLSALESWSLPECTLKATTCG